jgi:hypothetical protein
MEKAQRLGDIVANMTLVVIVIQLCFNQKRALVRWGKVLSHFY